MMPRAALLLGTALAASIRGAGADYSPIPLPVLFDCSEAIVLGTIGEVREADFDLEVGRTIAGAPLGRVVRVRKFEDWTCAARWTPYRTGQRAVFFLAELQADAGKPRVFRVLGSGNEGEMPIVDGRVHLHGLGLDPDAWDRFPVDGGEYAGWRFPLQDLLDVVVATRRCFDFDRSPSARPSHRPVRTTCREDELAEVASRSALAERLLKIIREIPVPATNR